MTQHGKKQNILLYGFMGSGKTTVGKILAKQTGRALADTDTLIEQQQGRSISEIFAAEGEDFFRQLETQLCVQLSEKRLLILSVGGGTVLREENVQLLKQSSRFFYLQVSLPTLQQRLAQDTSRPLLQTADREEKIAHLYAERRALYESCADVVVDGEKTPLQICEEILKQMQII